MYISLNWLKNYIKNLPEIVPENLNHTLTCSTGEMEGFVIKKSPPKGVILGRIKELKKHPNADKLKIVIINDGKNDLPQIICGGTNIEEGQIVPVATVGTILYDKEGNPFTINKAKIRDEESNGMICGACEIGLSNNWEGKEIMIIPEIAKDYLGKPINDFLQIEDDIIFEVENKSLSNRPDLTSQLGYARELFVIFKEKFNEKVSLELPTFNLPKLSPKKDLKPKIIIENKEKCRRMTCILYENIKIKESPDWLKRRLESIGQKPINSVVDITNFIMFDLGQPCHAFNLKYLPNNTLIIRDAKKDEKIKLLNDKEIKMQSDDLVLASEKEALDLAGVMGGKETGTCNDTTSIMFTCGNFEPTTIRRSAIRHGNRTDASMRFEKNIHPDTVNLGMNKFIELLNEIHPEANLVSQIIDEYPKKLDPVIIETDIKNILAKTGLDLSYEKVISILESLGCNIEKNKEKLKIEVPYWRSTKDLLGVDDLGEEVLRIHGFENVPLSPPITNTSPIKKDTNIEMEDKIRNILSNNGFTEILTRPFTTIEKMKKAGLDTNLAIVVDNPVSSEASHLRFDILPSIFEAMSDNVKITNIEFGIFEIGRIYNKDSKGNMWDTKKDLPLESNLLVFGICKPHNKKEKFTENIMLQFKNKIYDFLDHFGINNTEKICEVIKVKKSILKNYDLENHDVIICKINIDEFIKNISFEKKAFIPSLYPEVNRDLSVFIDKGHKWEEIKKIVMSSSKLITKVEPWDIYEKEGKKTLTFSYSLQSNEKTLEDKEIKEIFDTIIKNLKSKNIELTVQI